MSEFWVFISACEQAAFCGEFGHVLTTRLTGHSLRPAHARTHSHPLQLCTAYQDRLSGNTGESPQIEHDCPGTQLCQSKVLLVSAELFVFTFTAEFGFYVPWEIYYMSYCSYQMFDMSHTHTCYKPVY